MTVEVLHPRPDKRRNNARLGLALAGGGPLGGVYEIGALIALNEALEGADFHDLDVYVGVSAGSVVAANLANGISSAQLARMFIRNAPGQYHIPASVFLQPAFREFFRRGLMVPGLLAQGAMRYLRDPLNTGLLEAFDRLTKAIPTGVFDNEPMERYLQDLFSNRGHTNDFRRLTRELYLIAVDLDTGRPVRFGSRGYDHVAISKAVQASAALPGLYPPVKIDGRYYVDGALKRTLHASVALEAGADLIFCVNPIVPFDAELAPESEDKRHSTLIDGGLSAVLSQTFRSIIHSRMQVGMAKYESQYEGKDVVLFEPDRHDSKMFFTNVFSYSNREHVCQHAYMATRRDLKARRQQLEPVFARHGVTIREGVLDDMDRHFSEGLGEHASVNYLGQYRNETTNRLDETLKRLEGWLRKSA